MYIGRITTQSTEMLSRLRDSINNKQTQQQNAVRQPVLDRFMKTADKRTDRDPGVYHPNQLKVLTPESITYGKAEEMDLSRTLLAAADSDYTKENAVLNQYMKQYRSDTRLVIQENGEVSIEGEDLKLIGLVSDEELEAFRKELSENGLDDAIDWRGVKDDLFSNIVTTDNVENLQHKVDYISSRYAVLKDRIDSTYSGSEREEQLDMLNSIYKDAKEYFADSYKDNIGGFYEDLGQQGAGEDMKASLLHAIDQRTAQYVGYLSEHGNEVQFENPEDRWLSQDDGYMAAQLRKGMTESGPEAEKVSDAGAYSLNDLEFAGVYVKVLEEQLFKLDLSSYQERNDTVLGENLSGQYRNTLNAAADSDVGDKVKQLIRDTFEPFMDKLMDKIDQKIDDNRLSVSRNNALRSILRTDYIDRNEVYRAFRNLTA